MKSNCKRKGKQEVDHIRHKTIGEHHHHQQHCHHHRDHHPHHDDDDDGHNVVDGDDVRQSFFNECGSLLVFPLPLHVFRGFSSLSLSPARPTAPQSGERYLSPASVFSAQVGGSSGA